MGVYKRPDIDFGERNLENIYKSCGWLALLGPTRIGLLPLQFLYLSLFWLIENICVSV